MGKVAASAPPVPLAEVMARFDADNRRHGMTATDILSPWPGNDPAADQLAPADFQGAGGDFGGGGSTGSW